MKRAMLATLGVAVAGLVLLGQVVPAEPLEAAGPNDHEVWVTIQGTHQIVVLTPDGRGGLVQDHVIDYPALGHDMTNPHMILFGLHGRPGSRYGYVSNVMPRLDKGTTVIDAEERNIVAILDTGFRTHAVQASPDGSRAFAIAIGPGGIDRTLCDGSGSVDPRCGRITEIITDTATGTFTVGREFELADFAGVPGAGGIPRFDPICGSFTPDSQFFYTTLDSGGLVVFRINPDPGDPLFEVERIYPAGTGAGEIAAHGCGVGYSSDGKLMFANSGGLPGTAHSESFYYVFDIATHDLIRSVNLHGHAEDIHGMMLSPVGHEVVMAGRISRNFIVINQKTGALKPDKTFGTHLDGVELEAPDLVDFSPDGRWVYVSMRGPVPATGAHDIAGNTPGVAVVHYAPGRVVSYFPMMETGADPHGLAVRRLR